MVVLYERNLQRMKQLFRGLVLSALCAMALAIPSFAATSYTVTANLSVPGELNTQLPGVTAYVTNGANPLGADGYAAVAPTSPVSDNATLTFEDDGTMILTLTTPNPVFTIQSMAGCSNATVLSTKTVDIIPEAFTAGVVLGNYSTRINQMTIQLLDDSGTYIFTNSVEYPTLLLSEWTVPLTLEVEIPEHTVVTPTQEPTVEEPTVEEPVTEEPAEEVVEETVDVTINSDALTSLMSTVSQVLSSAYVSEDGSDVATQYVWVSQSTYDTLEAVLKSAQSGSYDSQDVVDDTVNALSTAYAQYTASEKSGTMLDSQEEAVEGRYLAPGTYTISANLWFNRADTGLPLNPHLTNPAFPPYNPVADNATLVVSEDGTAQVTIPICISYNVMSVVEFHGLEIADFEKNDDGYYSEITVDLGELTGATTVVSYPFEATIQMGDLAMSISGFDKDHVWPGTFEVNLSGVATQDGDVMPTVELTLMNAADASDAMSTVTGTTDSVDAEDEAPDVVVEEAVAEEAPVEEESSNLVLPIVIVVVAVCAIGFVVYKKKGGNQA